MRRPGVPGYAALAGHFAWFNVRAGYGYALCVPLDVPTPTLALKPTPPCPLLPPAVFSKQALLDSLESQGQLDATELFPLIILSSNETTTYGISGHFDPVWKL